MQNQNSDATPHNTQSGDLSPNPVLEIQPFVAQWLGAWDTGDVEAVVSKASEPFLFARELALTRSNLRDRYNELAAANQTSWGKLQFQAIRVDKVADLSDGLAKFLAGQAGLSSEDFVAFVESADRPGKGVYVLVRRKVGSFEIAGIRGT